MAVDRSQPLRPVARSPRDIGFRLKHLSATINRRCWTGCETGAGNAAGNALQLEPDAARPDRGLPGACEGRVGRPTTVTEAPRDGMRTREVDRTSSRS